jgi:hypothetical protein
MLGMWKRKTSSHRREMFEYKETFLGNQLCEDGVIIRHYRDHHCLQDQGLM